ncbi:MCE family protein [Amycolatopsis acidicola]|uniref:MCE family protein n=1 Tax=Amycolatopsis acidicola TaxID=2596893 RepID=A0A5N0UT27_9PSEU|nr:MCE family protein [Amycolatopsis acidicola]KAA9152313.1 MCE family protein [Amycolatopsis acidicola]
MKSVVPPLLKLGIFAVVTVLLTGVLGLTVANVRLGRTSAYSAVFTDVAGLNTGDDVRISGVRVGTVESIDVVDRGYALVGFDVDAKRRLPGSSTATIKYRNLLGQRYLALAGDLADPATLRPGDVIPVTRTAPALNLTVLFNGFRPLFQALSPNDVNTLASEIVQVLQGEGGTIDDLLAHTASLTSAIAGKDAAIGQTVDNLNAVLGTVNEHSDGLSDLIVQLQQLVSGLAAERGPLGDAISATGNLTNATAGLLTAARPALRDDITHLGVLSKNLADSSDLVEHFVQFLPRKTATLTRLGSYGSWFNYFSCSISGRVGVSAWDINLPVLPLPGTERPARCGP